MTVATRDEQTDPSTIFVNWTPIGAPDNGNSEVISYSLEFDANTGGQSWFTLVGYLSDYLDTSLAVSEQIQSGLTYKFRLRAKNKWGWGAYSEVSSVQAANKPLQISDLTSAVDESSGNVELSWTLAQD